MDFAKCIPRTYAGLIGNVVILNIYYTRVNKVMLVSKMPPFPPIINVIRYNDLRHYTTDG